MRATAPTGLAEPGEGTALAFRRRGWLQLASDEVHVWCARLDASPESTSRLYATLAEAERGRSARFRFERDRERFIVAHGVLRDLLGRYLRTEPRRIRYVHGPFGKPDLGPEFGGRLRFNLSHSAGLALIAVTAGSDVGVDLERVRPRSDYAEIARCFCSAAEVEHLSVLPEPLYAEAFVRCWTKKEAYVKACGDGLSRPPNSFSVPLTADPASGPVETGSLSDDLRPPRPWTFHTLQPAACYLGALAIEGRGWRVHQWRWSPGL